MDVWNNSKVMQHYFTSQRLKKVTHENFDSDKDLKRVTLFRRWSMWAKVSSTWWLPKLRSPWRSLSRWPGLAWTSPPPLAPPAKPAMRMKATERTNDEEDEEDEDYWKHSIHFSHTVHSRPLLGVACFAVLPLQPLQRCCASHLIFTTLLMPLPFLFLSPSGHWLSLNSARSFFPHCLSQEPDDTRGPLAL